MPEGKRLRLYVTGSASSETRTTENVCLRFQGLRDESLKRSEGAQKYIIHFLVPFESLVRDFLHFTTAQNARGVWAVGEVHYYGSSLAKNVSSAAAFLCLREGEAFLFQSIKVFHEFDCFCVSFVERCHNRPGG